MRRKTLREVSANKTRSTLGTTGSRAESRLPLAPRGHDIQTVERCDPLDVWELIFEGLLFGADPHADCCARLLGHAFLLSHRKAVRPMNRE